MTESQVPEKILIHFAPERWSSIRRFRYLMGPPFHVNNELSKGVHTTDNHLSKYSTLVGLINRQKDFLSNDLKELERDGYTPASYSREYAALIETLFSELYSSLDGVRRVIYSVFPRVQGVQNKSTEKLFQRAHDNSYGEGFPEEVRVMFASAYITWFPKLRKIRTEVTHGDIGSCYLDPKTNLIRYIHTGLKNADGALVIEDVVGEVNIFYENVSGLVNRLFSFFYSKLEPVDVRIVCLFFKGRLYERLVIPEENLSFNSGKCVSKSWFERSENLSCPLKDSCGAYKTTDVN